MSHLQKMAPLLALSLMLQACGTTGPSKQSPQEAAAALPSPQRDSVTVENLLRWPLKGTSGTEKVLAALDKVFEMKPLRASQLSGQGPVRLADGHVLSFAYVRKLSGDIDIGIDQKKCVSPDWAVALTGAVLNPVFQDAHGVDRGKQYDATGNGMALRINTTPETYRCVTALHIYPSPKERP
ncbi:hypothetical protein [Lysobacter capsici]|uniref:hypothetical protein n=1 Tax=Lysobacter capsici TaxID=435897 RepID=UPI001C006F01|nr:hypothetical protein [Lysobacter capsici]QWF15106.1 hypothetical protein KME82_14990 [Lysobacter capsici]